MIETGAGHPAATADAPARWDAISFERAIATTVKKRADGTQVSDVALLALIKKLKIPGFTKKTGKRPIRAARRKLIGWRG